MKLSSIVYFHLVLQLRNLLSLILLFFCRWLFSAQKLPKLPLFFQVLKFHHNCNKFCTLKPFFMNSCSSFIFPTSFSIFLWEYSLNSDCTFICYIGTYYVLGTILQAGNMAGTKHVSLNLCYTRGRRTNNQINICQVL